ncbi:biotin--[acetyl-CoA-carboxylase] ligase [Natranaerobius thermophilus]|uniref:Bifunctional ligase/repressor BirA n=1 Tax=Natranaerobius thermophilus (strain ATCC BAA-1301 / DSM 18059 / JW/NM-WN-LF) TaxID=457570 RepID=B2A3Q8_NATTJ|nr:biotin--[acetyl-CoA-carboxylase] ligase [Natranaerobius thermophilus]ACB83684.1 biotin--acetyl-CoA-carboxylase ligase [Natranaerobius thermophilus JW/NM-WN-LF]
MSIIKLSETDLSPVKSKILNNLKKQPYVSGEFLSSQLNVSRTAIWKNIQGLANLGYQIDPIKGKGYRLVVIPDNLYPWELDFSLKKDYQITYFDNIDSTNNYARSLQPPQVVIAEQQTKGRGRMGRAWFSAPGGIYFSLVITPRCSVDEIPTIPLLISTAITKVLKRELGIQAEIKWPNDILVQGQKVTGILVELAGETDAPQKAVIGVGINANQNTNLFPEELKKSVTSLRELNCSPVNRKLMLNSILEEITQLFFELPNCIPKVLNTWKEYSCTLGKKITVKQVSKTITGIAKDIDRSGALIVETPQGEQRILTGDLSINI